MDYYDDDETEIHRTGNGQTPPSPEPPFRKFRIARIIFFWVLVLGIIGGGVKASQLYQTYQSAKKAATKIYSSANVTKTRKGSSLLRSGKPVSILLMGTDTGALGRSFTGRTDTIMVLVLNPKKKSMTVVSLPRDAESYIYGYPQYSPGKLNSAYAYGGSGTAVKTVEKFLNVPIDYYVTINMGGLKNLINAVGGVTIKPTLTFSYGGYHFTKGKTVKLSGAAALAYCRMRHQDPNGDYGRQTRQRQVLIKLAMNATKLESLMNKKFLNEISKQMSTDLTFNDMLNLAAGYRVATHHMKSTHAQGTTQMIYGADFEVVSQSEKQRVTNLLRKALDLKHATTGSSNYSGSSSTTSSYSTGTNSTSSSTTYGTSSYSY